MSPRRKVAEREAELEAIAAQLEQQKHALLRASRDSSCLVRSRAIELLANLRGDDVRDRVYEALDDRDELVRVAALECLQAWRDVDTRAYVLGKLVSDSSELVRVYACDALAAVGEDKDFDFLEQRLPLTQPRERVAYLHALCNAGREQHLAAYLEGLTHTDYIVRCSTANGLAVLMTNDNLATITDALEQALERESTVGGRDSIERALVEARRHP